jgi:hypothetical protein
MPAVTLDAQARQPALGDHVRTQPVPVRTPGWRTRHAIAHEYLDVAERLSDAAMCRFSFLPG